MKAKLFNREPCKDCGTQEITYRGQRMTVPRVTVETLESLREDEFEVIEHVRRHSL